LNLKKYSSLTEIQTLIGQKKLSLPELLDYYFKQIEAHQHLNAFNEVFFYSASEQAKLVQKKNR